MNFIFAAVETDVLSYLLQLYIFQFLENNVPQRIDCGAHDEIPEILQHTLHHKTRDQLRHSRQSSLPLLLTDNL